MHLRRATAALVLVPLALAACQSTEQSTSATPGAETAAAPLVSPAQRAAYAQAGFALYEEDGRLWVLRAHTPEQRAAAEGHFPEKHVTSLGTGPGGATLKAIDADTILAFRATRPGFAAFVVDGRVWIFRAGSAEAQAAMEGELPEKHVTRVGAGPQGATLKAPDMQTIDAWMAAGA